MTPRDRAAELRRAIEDSDCEHFAFMCSACQDAAIERAIIAAVDAEREECAKVADEPTEWQGEARRIAAAIRARKATP
jgi:hypothetical protein